MQNIILHGKLHYSYSEIEGEIRVDIERLVETGLHRSEEKLNAVDNVHFNVDILDVSSLLAAMIISGWIFHRSRHKCQWEFHAGDPQFQNRA